MNAFLFCLCMLSCAKAIVPLGVIKGSFHVWRKQNVFIICVGDQCKNLASKSGRREGFLDWRLPLSGGIAGSVATAILYPIDTLKTIRQSDKSLRSFQSAFAVLSRNEGIFRKLYSGFLPAVAGSFPSSALYFGAYEGSKIFLYSKFSNENTNIKIQKPFLHAASAAIGNLCSSFVVRR